jgi:hypothetical protein
MSFALGFKDSSSLPVARCIELLAALEERNGHDKDVFHGLCSALLDELASCFRRTTCSDQVVDDEHI